MPIAESSINRRVVTLTVTAALMVGGLLAYQKMGRLEDPEFTIKDAQVITPYPGASAMEVAEEVTNVLEMAVQEMGQLDYVESTSEPGRSTLTVTIKNSYDKSTLPQVWDELRRKINDAQGQLPPGAGPSTVYDDYGDVYGVFYAVYGDGFSYPELYEHAKVLRRELLQCTDVARINIFAARKEAIYVEFSRAKLAALAISPQSIFEIISRQNLPTDAGRMEVGDWYIRIYPTGTFMSLDDLRNTLIYRDRNTGAALYLRDVATVRRGFVEPQQIILRYNGFPAIGLGISTVKGGNVVNMGESVSQRLAELQSQTPVGIEIGVISHQSDSVIAAINNFLLGLAESVAIVVGVLLFAMGLRSGLVIGFVLVLTVLATFMVMYMQGVMLERISLGALVIALGMLVDNAIVVVEGILVGQQRGQSALEAAAGIVKQTMWPLLGATVVAVLAFAAIGLSPDSTGEYCRSLFLVVMYSLMLSWVTAITVTPLLGVMFLKRKEKKEAAPAAGAPKEEDDPYAGMMFRVYRALLVYCMRNRWLTVAVMAGSLVLAVMGFKAVSKSFFPDSTRPQFMIHCWLPQGTHVERTNEEIQRLSEWIRQQEGVTDIATCAGKGMLRFLLTYSPENANSAYGLVLVGVESDKQINALMAKIQSEAALEFPDVLIMPRRFMLGPGDPAKIHARISGSDPAELRRLSEDVQQIVRDEPGTKDITEDWRQPVWLIEPVIAEAAARAAGLSRGQIAQSLRQASEGRPIGVYREADELLPIIAAAPLSERTDVNDLQSAQVYSPVAGTAIPMSQVVLGFRTQMDNDLLMRRNRLPTLTVKCDPSQGVASALFARLRPKVEQVFNQRVAERNLSGYRLEWGGEYEDSAKAQGPLMAKLPVIVALMFIIVVVLFNSLRQPGIIFLSVPLAMIGVTLGLLLTSQPFGFMALLGFLSLMGMQIKNAIVLIDEINMQSAAGKDLWSAVVESGLSRLRPVSMAALTTVLGMIPLLVDAFFVAMAVTIMFGLAFATVLTLVVVPVMYVIFYKIPTPPPAQGHDRIR